MVDTSLSGFEDPERIYEPRVFFVQKVTAVQGSYRPQLEREVADLRMSFELVTQQRPVAWDAVFAPEEFPTPSPANDGPGFRTALSARNELACQNSDALVIDSFGNGTAQIGHIQDLFLNGPLPRQVAVLKLKGNSDFSRAWEGFLEAHPRAEIIEFSDSLSLTEGAAGWMKKHAECIELMPTRRRYLNEKWNPISSGILSGLRRESPEVRAAIARSIGLDPQALYTLVSSPHALAGLCGEYLTMLEERYAKDISFAILMAGAHVQFSSEELTYWHQWADSDRVRLPRAVEVLRYELAQRDHAGVNKNKPMLRTIDAWVMLERRTPRG